MRRQAFTLIELLVVITILAILAAILFPVFQAAKMDGKKVVCLSNMRQAGLSVQLYVEDFDDCYPQTRQTSAQPDIDDAAGNIDEPIYGSVFEVLLPYVSSKAGTAIFSCPEDRDSFGKRCFEIDPDAPDVASFVTNAFFVFGLSGAGVPSPASTIYFSERRSRPDGAVDPFCDDVYRPWFNPANSEAPEDEMDPLLGAVDTMRHLGRSNFDFADGHAKSLAWTQTFSLPAVDLHALKQ